jgi:dienelactone hydrolase
MHPTRPAANSIPVLIAVLLALLPVATQAIRAADIEARQEFSLKTPRSRDPVLGGARDRISVSVWIPDGLKVARGAICNPFSKGDKVSGHWQAACRHWQFAYVQVDFDAVKKDEFDLLFAGLNDLAEKTGHPELKHVPLCYTGMSRGGGMSMQLAELRPERTIASLPVCLEVGPVSNATRSIPVLTIFGEKDGSQMAQLLEKLPAQRAESALWGIAVQWNRKHEFGQANNLSFVFLDDVIAQRLPSEFIIGEPVRLREIPEKTGWLGDVATWNKDGRRPSIATYENFKSQRAQACWFPSQRAAATWQAFVSASKDVKLNSPAGLGDGQAFLSHPAEQAIPVEVSLAKGVEPEHVELWNGGERIAILTSAPWEFEVKLAPGIHALYAIAHASGGSEQCSRPHTVVIEP